MSLAQYKKKRSENKTPEPFGGEPGKGPLTFVIQKHGDLFGKTLEKGIDIKRILSKIQVIKCPY